VRSAGEGSAALCERHDVNFLRAPKVGEFECAIGRHEYVGRFHIPSQSFTVLRFCHVTRTPEAIDCSVPVSEAVGVEVLQPLQDLTYKARHEGLATLPIP
jgi:hypothetical protein